MKEFITTKQQIDLLTNRGLSFFSKENAEKSLMTYGYYEIINGYSLPFLEDDKQDTYKEGATFEEIYSLFEFDKKLRVLTFSLLQDIESELKTIVAYRIAEKYGHTEIDYLNRLNYIPGKRYSDGYKIDKLIKKFENIISDNTQPFKHYREKHGHCPPWILLKGATFGNLINFIKLQKSEVKKQIVADFFGLTKISIENNQYLVNFFMETLYVLLKFRNRVAHGGRLYNYVPQDCKVDYIEQIHKPVGITEELYRKNFGRNDWNLILIFISCMQNKASKNNFESELLSLLNSYVGNSSHSSFILREE